MIQYLTLSRFRDVYERVARRELRDLFLMNYNKYLSDHMSDDDILQLIENRINEIRYHIKDINHTIYLFDDDAYFGDLRKHRKILEDAATNPELYDRLSEVDRILCDNIKNDYERYTIKLNELMQTNPLKLSQVCKHRDNRVKE